jgi:pimeloyl-ACP methyl ester carboxylesterase
MQLVVIDGGPHAIASTHSEQVNQALLTFLKQPARTNTRR